MRTNKERQQLIHKRTQEIKVEERKKRQYMISGISIAACLIAVVGLGMYIPSVNTKISIINCGTYIENTIFFLFSKTISFLSSLNFP